MESNEDNGQPPDDDERLQEENEDNNETPPADTNDTTPGETNDEHKGDSGQFELRRSDRERRPTEKMGGLSGRHQSTSKKDIRKRLRQLEEKCSPNTEQS